MSGIFFVLYIVTLYEGASSYGYRNFHIEKLRHLPKIIHLFQRVWIQDSFFNHPFYCLHAVC